MLKKKSGNPGQHEFLRQLLYTQLPATVEDHYLIGKLRAYTSAGLIVANIPDGYRKGDQLIQPPAQVLEITREGRRTVARLFNLPGIHD